MRGFLERLAASVIQPSKAVRPMSGSVFARHAPIESRRETPAAAPALASDIAPRAAASAPVHEQAAFPHRENSPIEAPIRYQPLMKPAASGPVIETETPAWAANRPPAAAIDNELANEAPRDPERARMPSTEPQPAAVERPASVAREAARASAVHEVRPVASLAPVVSPVARPAEPDIEIRIGRIEVLAMPPAARPAPAPPRPSMSLDDYLRRSNARTR
jgi:hypothetical protein